MVLPEQAVDGVVGTDGAMPTRSAAALETGPQVQHAPKFRIRPFDGTPGAYQEWKREVAATAMLYEISDAHLASMVYLALEPGEGKPRDLLSDMEIGEVCCADGLIKIWKIDCMGHRPFV